MLRVLQQEDRERHVDPKTQTSLRLDVADLQKSYSSPGGECIEVLRKLSFSAVGGTSLAIMGASGAGKSTLLHLLGGLESADAGMIHLNDDSILEASPSNLAGLRNARIGFIFQFHHLLTDLSALENVALPLMIGRFGQREAFRKARCTLAQMGLNDRVDHSVTDLSGGEQQRVAVARAVVTEPSLVLADEPTGNLDAAIEHEISERLVSYARETGAIVIVATHNERLARICDRVLSLKNGVVQERSLTTSEIRP